VAFGWLNLTPEQLDDLTPREFNNKLRGFQELYELKSHDNWERSRLLASTLLMPHTKKGKGIEPQKLWPFHWDKKSETPKPLSAERIKYIDEKRKLIKDGLKKGNGSIRG
jgi:hypothetical protein